ncbi:MAG TPA: flagellar biosynthesis protein FliQ [Acidimicrobiales bacterium]|nr:flagellar biosynthesis protein FliQ [Acidimicrobiales bacterium]
MTDTSVIEIVLQALILVAKVAGPLLATSLVVGLLVSLIQSVVQVQEMTLVFVPKMIAVALVLVFAGHWMLNQIVGFTDQMFAMIPRLLSS